MVGQLMAASPAQLQFYLMALIAETAPGKAARANEKGGIILFQSRRLRSNFFIKAVHDKLK